MRHVPTTMVSPWSLRVTITAYGLANTMEMLETLFPGTMTSLSALWIGTGTPILVRKAYFGSGSERGDGIPSKGMIVSAVRLPSGKDQGKKENKEDFYSGEGMESQIPSLMRQFFPHSHDFCSGERQEVRTKTLSLERN